MATQNTSNPKKQATIEQTKHELSAAPLTVMAQYIKDFSFENPNPLQTLKESHEAPEINLNLDIQANPVEEHIFEITLHLKAEAKRASHTLFIAELQYAGTFKIGEIGQFSWFSSTIIGYSSCKSPCPLSACVRD